MTKHSVTLVHHGATLDSHAQLSSGISVLGDKGPGYASGNVSRLYLFQPRAVIFVGPHKHLRLRLDTAFLT